jgi:triosephosphate isomerase
MPSERTALVAGNWKMHKTPAEAGNFARNLLQKLPKDPGAEVVVCPPFLAIPAVASKLAGSWIGWGAQNMHWEAEGSFTGEVSAPMLQALGCRYVILGHSERRVNFEETNEQIRKKMKAAFSFGLRPIFCLGEEMSTRDTGDAEYFCLHQLAVGLEGLPWTDPESLVIAYEPVWAIGTGRTATPADAVKVIGLLRKKVGSWHGPDFAERVRILYGGSVKPDSITGFMKEEQIDGVLVGGASLNLDSFTEIARLAAEAKRRF